MTHGKPVGEWDLTDALAYAGSRWSYGGSKLQRDARAIELLVAALRRDRAARRDLVAMLRNPKTTTEDARAYVERLEKIL